MSRMLLAAGRYIQGPGAINEIGLHARRLGSSGLLIGGKTALNLCGTAIEESLAAQGISCRRELFRGVSSRGEINRLVAAGGEGRADFVIALGGGSALDAGKAVAFELKAPVIVVPTTVASDAPCSALSVIYSEEGVFESYLFLPRNPDCVLVDTGVVAQSPARFLVAGMGDALATVWESGTCARSGKPNPLTEGGQQTLATLALARLCYDTLREWGLQARLAVERGVVTPAVEAIVEANILLSGLSSENGGHAAAHSIHNGLTTLAATRNKLHGEKVAFGVLGQLVLEGRSAAEIREVQAFCSQVGLPICLAELDLPEPTREEIRQVAETAVAPGETIHASWFPVTATLVEAAIWTADALGTEYRNTLGNQRSTA
ncbi:MAG: glycerol dehydrogenase [Trichloromonadaceae bacterium]